MLVITPLRIVNRPHSGFPVSGGIQMSGPLTFPDKWLVTLLSAKQTLTIHRAVIKQPRISTRKQQSHGHKNRDVSNSIATTRFRLQSTAKHYDLGNYQCYLVILCPYVKTHILDVSTESEIIGMNYGMSAVDRSLKILRYVWVIAARRRLTIA